MRLMGTPRNMNMPKHNTQHNNTTKVRPPPPNPHPHHTRAAYISQHTPLEHTAHQRTTHTAKHRTSYTSHTTTNSALKAHQLPQLSLILPKKRHPMTRPNISQRNTHRTQRLHPQNPHGATTRNHGRPRTLKTT